MTTWDDWQDLDAQRRDDRDVWLEDRWGPQHVQVDIDHEEARLSTVDGGVWAHELVDDDYRKGTRR